MKKFEFKNITSKFKLKKKDKTKIKIHPSRDWAILLISFFILLAGVFGGSYYLHNIYITPINVDVEDSTSIKSINVKDMEKIIEEYNTKKESFLNYTENPPEVIDPS